MSLDWHWNLVVLDEAHEHMVASNVLRPHTLPHLLHNLISRRTDRALIVTGTPAPTKTLDIFSLVDALSNGSMLGLGDSGKIFKIQKQNRERERERGEFWIVFMTHTYMNHTHSLLCICV
jgi:hypothetical protein